MYNVNEYQMILLQKKHANNFNAEMNNYRNEVKKQEEMDYL